MSRIDGAKAKSNWEDHVDVDLDTLAAAFHVVADCLLKSHPERIPYLPGQSAHSKRLQRLFPTVN